jgi:alpha-D-xyloside xylohydrolase
VNDGVEFHLRDSGTLKLEVCSESIIRVVYTAKPSTPSPARVVIAHDSWAASPWQVHDARSSVSVTTRKLEVRVGVPTGGVSFYDLNGNLVLNDQNNGRSVTPVVLAGQQAYQGSLAFDSPADEGIYGFGNFTMRR